MRHCKLLLMTVLFLSFACAGWAEISQYKQGGGQVSKIDLGSVSVMPVEDVPGSMDISLFKGPLSQDELAKYFDANGKSPSSVNVFLLNVGGKLILVDAGWGPGARANGKGMAYLTELGIKPEMIGMVLLTHMHGDHITGLITESGKAFFPNARVMVSKPEADFWLSDSTMTSDSYKGGAELARKAAAAYQGRFDTFNFGDTVASGVLAMEAVGHTPGHTAFLVDGGNGRLLIAGDFLHGTPLQFEQPEEYPVYDMDPQTALKTRRTLLDLAAQEDLIISGMHIPFPGTGKVQKAGTGYKFIPLPME